MNTLEILSCSSHEDGKLLATYRFGQHEFHRGIILPERVANEFSQEDYLAMKLHYYIALADAIYCYDLDYFDEITVPFMLDAEEVSYFETTFFKGLAEFRYTNNIELSRKITIRVSPSAKVLSHSVDGRSLSVTDDKALLLNGGGKDGAVACELAKQLRLNLAWCSLTSREIRRKVANVSGVKDYLEVERIPCEVKAFQKKYQGHKPMSLFVAMVSTLTAYLDGRKYVIAANEYSANFPNVIVDGESINHQYTKSAEHEASTSSLFEHAGIPVRYFSITRPLYELQIMKIFARFPKYHSEFLSCNRGLKDGKWCLKCAKCAFVVGGLYIFDQASAESVWGPKNEVYHPSKKLVDESIELINPDVKPFECIGTTEENAVLLASLLRDIKLTGEQRMRYEKYLAAISDRAGVSLESLNDSNHFPPEFRDRLLVILEHELVR